MPQNTTGHTPGPWVVANGNHVWFDGSDALSSPRICTLQNTATPVRQLGADEITANARLIAAAPDMLAALKGLVENPAFELGSPKVSGRAGGEKRDAAMTAWDGFVEAARAAISKAEAR